MVEQKIDFAKIEKKWQDRWKKEKVFEVSEKSKKPKYYVLEMFPYPSGVGLHMGHAWNYSIGDIHARFKRMRGYNLLYPMGYDALGLPAENAAIKAGIHPEEYTKKSIINFTRQFKTLGISYDWSRMINTADPSYYKWDQWIFLKLFEKGLAYQRKASVNWCDKCNSVLANEQVVNGKCWRHDDTDVEIKQLKQWFLKITDYADELLDFKGLDWPKKTIALQKNWIGKSNGVEIDFEVETPAHVGCTREPKKEKIPVFTTRPDTIYGVTFLVIAAQHPRLMEFVSAEQEKDVEKFLKKIKTTSQKSMKDVDALNKEGVFTGSYAINPVTREEVPIYAGNFVVADYGSGMVMAVPAHDQRDFEFAKKYDIEIKQVIEGDISKTRAWTGEGKLINSDKFNGMNNEKAKKEITDYLIEKKLGRRAVNYKLRDWLVSRQRYWGTPIPIVYCDKCGAVPVPEKDLPVKLPKDVKFGKGNPLLTNEKWINTKCPKCNGKARRETDTMDTFVNSSWYYLRYTDSKNDKKIFSSDRANYWCPVDFYIGGIEHACMHLIYVRFYTMFLADLGLIDFREPAKKLFHQGMLAGEGGIKMSKSKGNVINPDEVSNQYGIDTARFFLLSLASPDKPRDWSEAGIQGSLRLMKKIIGYFDSVKIGKDSEGFEIEMNKKIKQISENIEDVYGYRDATIRLRELFSLMEKQKEISKKSLESFLKMFSVFCPHIAEELWEKIKGKGLISLSSWPEYDEKRLKNQKGKKDISDKIISYVTGIVEKVEEKQKVEKVYIYVMPFEINQIDKKKIEKEIGKKTEIYAVNDSKKHDPEDRAGKAKPGMPGVYLE